MEPAHQMRLLKVTVRRVGDMAALLMVLAPPVAPVGAVALVVPPVQELVVALVHVCLLRWAAWTVVQVPLLRSTAAAMAISKVTERIAAKPLKVEQSAAFDLTESVLSWCI